MKKTLFTIAAALALLCLAEQPSGSYLTWLGNNAGKDATANQSEFVGALSGQNAHDIYRSSFFGVMSGYNAFGIYNCFAAGIGALANATNVTGSVFIGPYAGRGARDVSGRTDINGQFFSDKGRDEFYLSPDPSKPSVLAPLSYSAGTLRENVDFKIETTAANKLAFENAVADVWLSAYDGSDANDGLSPTSAVKTIAGAYTAAYNAATNGTLNASNEIVVAVAEGRYAPCVIYSALTNGIAYIATGDRKDTIIDGMTATNGTHALGSPHNRTVAVGVRMACPDVLYSVSMRGFTLTGFNHYYPGGFDVRSQVIYGIKFSKCDFTANDAMVREDSAFASGIFDECDFHGNKLRCWRQYAVDAFFGGNSGWSIYGDDVILSRCHVWDNDMSICAYLIRSPSTRQKEVSHCLLEVDFYEYYGRPGGSYNTIIAKTLSNPHVTGLTHNKDGQFNTNSFIVVASPGIGYDESIYNPTGASCVVSNANLTADFVAADASCPSVRSGDLPDYGYRNSGFRHEADPTVPEWAKAENKPSYTAAEVGAATASDIANAISANIVQAGQDLVGDEDGKAVSYGLMNGILSGFVLDASLSDWAKAETKPTYTASEVGAASPGTVSNIVTQALVRDRLGVYLYVGEDGGIYVHTGD